jgi:hypothetical protein
MAEMTQQIWNALSETDRIKLRSASGLTPQLIGLEGWRVAVIEKAGDKPRRFIVGCSTGWIPCHLEIKTKASRGGSPAAHHYHLIQKIRKVR